MEILVAPPVQDVGPTVGEVLGEDEVASLKKRLAGFLTDDQYAEWRKGMAGALASVPWPAAVDTAADLVGAFLDTPFAPPLQKVYANSKLVQRFLDPDAYDPQEAVVVELAEHTVKASRSPSLDVTVNGAAVGSLTVDIAITLDLKGLVLTVQDARIKQITPGTCVGTGTVSMYGKTLAKKVAEPIKLPALDLGAGVPIVP